MKFIEIREGLSISKESIEAIERTDEGCIIYTAQNMYQSTFPYMSFLELLEMKETQVEPAQYWSG